VDTIQKTIAATLSGISQGNVDQAKRTLKHQFLRTILADRFSLAEHIMVTRKDPLQHLKEIDAINLGDVQKVAKNLASSKPLLVAVGDVTGVPYIS